MIYAWIMLITTVVVMFGLAFILREKNPPR